MTTTARNFAHKYEQLACAVTEEFSRDAGDEMIQVAEELWAGVTEETLHDAYLVLADVASEYDGDNIALRTSIDDMLEVMETLSV